MSAFAPLLGASGRPICSERAVAARRRGRHRSQQPPFSRRGRRNSRLRVMMRRAARIAHALLGHRPRRMPEAILVGVSIWLLVGPVPKQR